MGKRLITLTEAQLIGIIRETLNEIWAGGGSGINRQKQNKPQSLRISNGFVVLVHHSSEKITNGFIDGVGKQKNNYSNNSDFPNCFWASEEPGEDPSNVRLFDYYCLVSPELVYDYETNPKEYKSIKEAAMYERFVSTRWPDGAIAVVSNKKTKIDYIESHTDIPIPGVYDRKWNLLRTPMKSRNGRRGGGVDLVLLDDMKAGKNVPVPDFLDHGYSYYQLKELAKQQKK